MTLAELIERLEKTTGPDRELDIALGAFIPEPRAFNLTDKVLRNGKHVCPEFTRSIDDALTLVPKGWNDRFGLLNTARDKWVASIEAENGGGVGNARTAAVAICIAALKARAKT